MMRKGLGSSVLVAAAALAVGAGPAGAHGGDTALVHSCIDNGGNVTIIAADATCKKNALPLDWARDGGGAGNTYGAGFGLALEDDVFSVTGAPWGGLTGVPGGFADGVDDVGTAPTWETLAGVPDDLRNGDDDGSAAVSALSTDLAADDGTPDQDGDPVSFSKIRDLTAMTGEGRITGDFIANLTIRAGNLANDSVDGDKIAEDSIETRHLAPGVLDRSWATVPVDPASIASGERLAVPVPDMFNLNWGPDDIVTVSPPAGLESDLVYAGSDVLGDGTLVVYLHNIRPAEFVDGTERHWKVRVLKVGG